MHRSLFSFALIIPLALACRGADAEVESARLEGRTAAVANGAALYAIRLWTAPELDSLDRAGVRIDSLVIAPDTLRLRRGERVPLERLTIVALDPEGDEIPAAPILLEAGSPAISLTTESVVADDAGTATIRVRGLLRTSRGGAAVRDVRIIVE